MTAPVPQSEAIDASDVPAVTVRELALALQLLGSIGGTLDAAGRLSDGDIRRVEQAFWHHLKRHRVRKTAVLLRFRCLIEVCRGRRFAALIAVHGQDAVLELLAAAASMRLNAAWGFSPHKLALAVTGALKREPAAIATAG